MIIKANKNTFEFNDKTFWHLVPADSLTARIFYNNINCGEGVIFSTSFVETIIPNLKDVHTPYSLSNINDEKEKMFELIRKEHYRPKPTRLKSMFLFDSEQLAQKAIESWFQNERRKLHECKVASDASIHKADTYWLNCNEEDWIEFAHKYWTGEMSNSPFQEILVNGALYFPEWRDFQRLVN